MKKGFVAFCIALAAGVASAVSPKYVFLFIGDGMSTPQRMVAEEFSRATGRGSLVMNKLPVQATTRTCSANSLITDSAAAATAIACGKKTNNHFVGVDPQERPLESCACVAHKAGRKVGIVTTVTITHATPAGFYAHRGSRGNCYGIALDLVNSGFEFFAGGGLSNTYDDKTQPEYAECGNAYDYAARKGYRIVKTKAEFMALKPSDGKILTRFTDSALENSIDVRDDSQPTLAEIVEKAIEMLDSDKGFFLMAEGGRVDWAGHANDAATNLREVLALDDAVTVAIDFQDRHPDETLVIVTGDHETGGLSMGFAGTGYAIFPKRLAAQTMSVRLFDKTVGEWFRAQKEPAKLTVNDVVPLIQKAFGFHFPFEGRNDPMTLTADEFSDIAKAFDHDRELYRAKVEETKKYDGKKRYLLGGACRLILSHKSGLGWSTGGHTAMPVLTTSKGPGSELFSGFMENTDIAKRIKSLYK